jgi:hypothetical protein
MATLAIATLLAGCGSSHPAGPPRAAALAARLGCRVAHADPDPHWAADTVQYVDATGGLGTGTRHIAAVLGGRNTTF